MKTLLLAAALALSATPAAADQLPARFLVHWCGFNYSETHHEGMKRVSKPCQAAECGWESVTVTSQQILLRNGGVPDRCAITDVGNYKPGNPRFRNTYFVLLDCNPEKSGSGEYVFELINGRLGWARRN